MREAEFSYCGQTLRVNYEHRFVTLNGLLINLSIKQYETFAFIVAHALFTVTKEMLFDALYGSMEERPDFKILDVYVCVLRKRLDLFSELLETVWGRGWQWNLADIRQECAPTPPEREKPSLGNVARRPYVTGPDGSILTLADLPKHGERWVARRKGEVIAAVNGRLITSGEACRRFGLTAAELEQWQNQAARFGFRGLRLTHTMRHR